MKKFLVSLLVFLIPIILLMVTEVVLPPNFFAFRPWEALKYSTTVATYCQFYPSETVEMDAVGDLRHHTPKAVVRRELWITDKIGYRNDAFVEEADVLIIGDSFIAGTGISQEDLLSNRLKAKFGKELKVYNMAPSSFTKFDYFLRLGIVKKPKLIVFAMVERHMPAVFYTKRIGGVKSKLVPIPAAGEASALLDRAFRFSSLKWLNARIRGYKGNGRPAVGDSTVFFLEGSSQKHKESDLKRAVKVLQSYQQYCDTHQIEFLFLPMPDKETVYYELVPFDKQPTYLFQLDSLVRDAKIATINTLGLYNDYRKHNKDLLYQKDDSHWTPIATELVSKELYKVIKQKK